MTGTCSGAWAEIVQDCIDPNTGETWLRELGRTSTTHTEKRLSNGQCIAGPSGTVDEFPERFELTDDGEEMIANAHLWAAAPDLLEALKDAHKKLMWFAESYPADLGKSKAEFFAQIDSAIAKSEGDA
jgi:hypothetical protein